MIGLQSFVNHFWLRSVGIEIYLLVMSPPIHDHINFSLKHFRSNNRKKQARKLDEAAEQQNEEDGMVKNDAKKASVGGIGT